MKKIIGILFLITAFNSNLIAQKDSTITLKVKGLTCRNDLNTIATAVKDAKGVSECKPGKLGPTSTYKITYNATLVTRKEIVAIIEATPGCGDGDEKPYKVKL
jgi:copper chaperone CopZ